MHLFMLSHSPSPKNLPILGCSKVSAMAPTSDSAVRSAAPPWSSQSRWATGDPVESQNGRSPHPSPGPTKPETGDKTNSLALWLEVS